MDQTTTTTWGTPFQPGQSGNPKGRPRVGESVADYIRQLAGPDAKAIIDKLYEIATGAHRDVNARIKAGEVLLTRGYGKPPDTLNLNGSLTTFDPARLARLSDSELEYVAGILRKLREGDDASGQ